MKRTLERLRGLGRQPGFRDWPPVLVRRQQARLGALAESVARRYAQGTDVDDLLPDSDVDFSRLKEQKVSDPGDVKKLARHDMADQRAILQGLLKSRSELELLNALVISYLRRQTPYTDKARDLFQRLWQEERDFLLAEINTRWLISTLQTFADHGTTETQRAAGVAGFIYGGLLRMHEKERAMQGLDADQLAESTTSVTRPGFRQTGGFILGKSDALINLNGLVYEYALCDEIAGPVLEELMIRVRDSKTVFHRMDETRKALNAYHKNYPNAWSFGEKPE